MKVSVPISFLLILLGLAACRDAGVTGPGPRLEGAGTYVVNEGGFGGGGNLSFYDPSTGAVEHNVVRGAGAWLFPNDILVHGGRVYVAVNGSDLVSVIDPATDSAVGEIRYPPGTGPGLLSAAGGSIYSANYNGTVSAIDIQGDSILASSGRVVGFPGAIVAGGGRLFVSDLGAWPDTGRDVVALDPLMLTVVGTVRTGGGPAGMAFAGGKLYVGTTISRRVWRVDPLSLVIEDSAGIGTGPGDFATDGSSLFVLTPDAVRRIPLRTFEPDTLPLIVRASGLYHYAMGFDAASGELYLSTITSGGGQGEVRVYTTAGRPVGPSFGAGIFPGAFGFYRPVPP